jgi:hypothetical protein
MQHNDHVRKPGFLANNERTHHGHEKARNNKTSDAFTGGRPLSRRSLAPKHLS